jgi:DNA-binding MarR family transcriptional regulator
MVIDRSAEGEASPDIEQLAAQLHRVVCKMRFGLDRYNGTTRLPTGDLTSPQLSLMFALSCRGPMRMRDLAAHECVYIQTASLMVDRLEQRGLVKRFGTPSNLRAVFVKLTRRGHAQLEAVRARRVSVFLGLLGDFGDDDLRALHDALGPIDRLASLAIAGRLRPKPVRRSRGDQR